jgi:hypothetical protein
MALSGQMNNRAGAVALQQSVNQIRIADVPLHKDLPGFSGKTLQVFEIARIGELVQVDNRACREVKPVQHEVGSDETRTAGNEYCVGQFQAYRLFRVSLRIGVKASRYRSSTPAER